MTVKAASHPCRALQIVEAVRAVDVIDQTLLPHEYRLIRLSTLEEAANAIRVMQVRGAPLIGVTAAFGVAFALLERADEAHLAAAVRLLAATRPTAVNLHWALDRMQAKLLALPIADRAPAAWLEACRIAVEDADQCAQIGKHGLALLRPLIKTELNLMTHCNAGSLATIEYGTALAPIYAAHEHGIKTHVWVSETRPRNQGLLTAWELKANHVAHTLFADNAAGWIMMNKRLDAVIVGADRIAANGDVANKVGTYLKALAAREAGIPFYVAAPHSTIDFKCPDGSHIPVEERSGDEVRLLHGLDEHGKTADIRQIGQDTPVINPAFDITPAQYISGIITEKGVCEASEIGLRTLFPE